MNTTESGIGNVHAKTKKFNEWSPGMIIFVVVFGLLLLFSSIFSNTQEGKKFLENSDKIRYSEELQRKKADMLFEAGQAAKHEEWKRERR